MEWRGIHPRVCICVMVCQIRTSDFTPKWDIHIPNLYEMQCVCVCVGWLPYATSDLATDATARYRCCCCVSSRRAPSPRVRWAVCMQTTNGGWLREATHNGRRQKKKNRTTPTTWATKGRRKKKTPRQLMESFVDCVVQKTGSKHTCIPVHYHRDGLIVCHTTLIAFSIFRPADREYYNYAPSL